MSSDATGRLWPDLLFFRNRFRNGFQDGTGRTHPLSGQGIRAGRVLLNNLKTSRCGNPQAPREDVTLQVLF